MYAIRSYYVVTSTPPIVDGIVTLAGQSVVIPLYPIIVPVVLSKLKHASFFLIKSFKKIGIIISVRLRPFLENTFVPIITFPL